jgi:hypothetical protein
MYRQIKSSHALVSVMAIILLLPGGAVCADEGRYDNHEHQGSTVWNGHYEVHHENYGPHYAYYNRGYRPGNYPHYYAQKPSCGSCTQNNQHNHNNHDSDWWHFW